MENILDAESTSILSSAFKFTLASQNVTADRFFSVQHPPLENFGTMLESETAISQVLLTRMNNTTAPEPGAWPGDTATFINAHSPGEYEEISLEHEATFGSRNIRVFKHKPSAITFADLPLDVTSETTPSNSLNTDTSEELDSNDGSEEDYEEEDDDVFTDLPTSRYTFTGIKRRSSHPRRLNSKLFEGPKGFCGLYTKKLWNNDMDIGDDDQKTLMEERSQWSKSMSCLLMKLEQLNVDIEDAITTTGANHVPTTLDFLAEQINPEMMDHEPAAPSVQREFVGMDQAQHLPRRMDPVKIANHQRDHSLLLTTSATPLEPSTVRVARIMKKVALTELPL